MLDVASVTPSPDHTLVAYAADLSGYETYQLRIRRVGGGGGSGSGGAAAVGSLLDDVIEGTNGDVEWGADNTSLYYLTMDDAHRPHKLWRHVLGTPQGDDVCLLTEDDERFWLGMHKTLTGDYIVADASSKTTSEVRLVALRGADGAPLPPAAAPAVTLVAPRRDGVLYEVEHWRQAAPAAGASAADWLVVLTNADGAKNFRVAVAPVATPGPEHWRTVIPHARSVHVTGVDVFARFWAIYGREGGYKNVWIVDAAGVGAFLASSPAVVEVDPSAPGASGAHVRLTRIPPREAVYVLGGSGGNMDYDARVLRFTYGSPVTPSCTCEYRFDAAGGGSSSGAATGMVDGDWAASVTVLKQKEVPNCNPADYATTRVFATAPDGTKVPVSIVWRPSAHPGSSSGSSEGGVCPLPVPAPTLLYGYGSYGHSIDMYFSSSVLSLCDRGVVYAVAHIRGGGEMGRFWYEDEGKLLAKKNTFSDFIACAEHLVAAGWGDRRRICAMGASAGGLLMGAVVNARPDLWAAIVSQVGFVDVILSVADPSVPLAVTEWEEWGNPNEKAYFDYIRSYSPIENVRPAAYPPMLLTAGLNDSRVAYWEIAKFAQRLRAANTGGSQILCKTDMGAGHFSYNDRYVYLREKAFEYAWLLQTLGVKIS